jgi:hypothetical protein
MSRELTFVEKEDQRLYNTCEKWYIRDEWLHFARRRLEANGRRFIRYLTLTCSLAYDVIFLKDNGVIETTEIGYGKDSVAFCEKDVQRSVYIRGRLPGAKFHEGPVEGLLGAGRINFSNKVDSWFPFDVINIDICGAPFSQNAQFIDAMRKLFMAQRIKNQSFTLFVTTSSIEDGDSEGNKQALRTLIRRNYAFHNFERIYRQKYPQETIEPYHEFLSVAIPKLIVDSGFQQGFNVECKRKFTYVGGQNLTQMVSFIFDCDLPTVEDVLGFLSTERTIKLVGIITRHLENVNTTLRNDPTSNHRCEELQRMYRVADQ